MSYNSLFLTSYLIITSTLFSFSQQNTVASVPLVVQHNKNSKQIILFLTGDGGITTFTKELANQFYKANFSVITLDTRKYFWKAKNPDQFGRDASQVLNYYMTLWNQTNIGILGYSFGADVAAFLPAKLDERLRLNLKKLVLLSPGISTDLEVKLSNLLRLNDEKDARYKIYPELQKLKLPVTCIFGKDEEASVKQNIKPSLYINKKEVPGGHKYDDDIPGIAKLLIREFSE